MDLEVARSLADLVSVDAMVTEAGKVMYANTSLEKRVRDQMGWRGVDGHHLSELFDEPHVNQVREWYDELRSRDDRFGVLELRSRGRVDRKLTAIRLEERELIVVWSQQDLPVMDRYRDLETSARIFHNYLRDGGLGLMILQDEEDRDAVIRYVSPEGADILERKPEDLQGLELVGFASPDEQEGLLERCRARMTGSPTEAHSELRLLSPDGEILLLDTVMGPSTWDGEPAVYCLFRDESERQIMIEELRRFEQGFEMLDDTMVLADKDFNIIYINPKGLERSGYTHEEVMGQPAYIFAATDEGELDPLDLAQKLFETGKWTGERTAISKDGRKYPVEISVVMTIDHKGDPEMVSVVSRDITARKEVEREMLQARDRAEFFTDLMSHDINNYIQGVIGYLDLLSNTELDGEQRTHLLQASEQADRVSTLIDRVRTISRAQHAMELKPVDLKAVVEQAVADVRPRAAARNVEVRVGIPQGPVPVMADELLDEVVINLLDNAIKFCKGTDAVVEVGIDTREERGTAVLSVSDRGPGIPDEFKESVFFRFVRKREEAEGTGLGLSLVMALTERYRGSVWVEDRLPGRPGEGARFVVEVPLA